MERVVTRCRANTALVARHVTITFIEECIVSRRCPLAIRSKLQNLEHNGSFVRESKDVYTPGVHNAGSSSRTMTSRPALSICTTTKFDSSHSITQPRL
jgi:hypothetical protein